MEYHDEEDYAIGIDLGTTYCCAAVYRNEAVEVIPSKMGSSTTPSHVAISTTGEVRIGEVAKKGMPNRDVCHHFYDMKRLIGRRYNDKDVKADKNMWPFPLLQDGDAVRVSVNGNLFSPEEISALVLNQLKQDAEKHLRVPVTKAVITVPAYFNSSQRQATKNAGKLAGFEVLRIINEPTAAALAYNHKAPVSPPQNVLIFDLGGGTFDVAILRMSEDGEMKVTAVGGDSYLGGEDFDKTFVNYCLKEFEKIHGIDPLAVKNSSLEAQVLKNKRLKRLKNECELQKTFLTASRHVIIQLDNFHGDIDLEVPVSRQKFNDMNSHLFDKCIQVMDDVIKSAGLGAGDVDDVILVGGSTKIPEIQARVVKYFGGKKLNFDISGDEAVAYGAALQAAVMTDRLHMGMRIQDVIPLPIGIDSFNKNTGQIEFYELIPRNTPVPYEREAPFSIRYESQESIVTNILEGLSKVPAENHLVATFRCSSLPQRTLNKKNKLVVKISVNYEGILKLSVSVDGQTLENELVIYGFLHPVEDVDKDVRQLLKELMITH